MAKKVSRKLSGTIMPSGRKGSGWSKKGNGSQKPHKGGFRKSW